MQKLCGLDTESAIGAIMGDTRAAVPRLGERVTWVVTSIINMVDESGVIGKTGPGFEEGNSKH